MNQKEYNLIAEVIRGRKENTAQSYHFGYSQQDIERGLAIISDLEDFMAYELKRTYSNFNEQMFREVCKL